VQGTSHIKSSVPCQDAYAYKIIDDSTIFLAVADGLGSAACSQIGSKLAVSSALAYLELELSKSIPNDETSWKQLIRECFLFARVQLEEEAQQNQAILAEYGTTLIVAILSGDWLVTGHIGDGAMVAAFEDGGLVLISAPQNGEYVNETLPLTMSNFVEFAEFKACSVKVKALALMSDGIQHVSIRTADNTPHQPFFEPLFRQLPGVNDSQKASQNLAEFMASGQICSHTDDDKTLVLIGKQSIG
jgi:hypothetical protein